MPERLDQTFTLGVQNPNVLRVPEGAVALSAAGAEALLLGEVHPAEEGLEAGVGAQVVEEGNDVDIGQQHVSFLGSPFEPGDGLLTLPRFDVHHFPMPS